MVRIATISRFLGSVGIRRALHPVVGSSAYCLDGVVLRVRVGGTVDSVSSCLPVVTHGRSPVAPTRCACGSAVERRVFVSQPPGYWDGTDTVFRLRRAFYGQRDAGRLFWLHLEEVLMQHGWRRSNADPCVWIKRQATQWKPYSFGYAC